MQHQAFPKCNTRPLTAIGSFGFFQHWQFWFLSALAVLVSFSIGWVVIASKEHHSTLTATAHQHFAGFPLLELSCHLSD